MEFINTVNIGSSTLWEIDALSTLGAKRMGDTCLQYCCCILRVNAFIQRLVSRFHSWNKNLTRERLKNKKKIKKVLKW